MENKILEEVKETLRLSGNNFIYKIFEDYGDDLNELYIQLKKYNSTLMLELEEEVDEETGESKFQNHFSYIYICNQAIDFRNIGRIKLDNEYNVKKNNYKYLIIFKLKFPTPNEEEFRLTFDTEQERNKAYDIIQGKLKNCNINIL